MKIEKNVYLERRQIKTIEKVFKDFIKKIKTKYNLVDDNIIFHPYVGNAIIVDVTDVNNVVLDQLFINLKEK